MTPTSSQPSIPHLGFSAQPFVTKSDFAGPLCKNLRFKKKMPSIALLIKCALSTCFGHGDRHGRNSVPSYVCAQGHPVIVWCLLQYSPRILCSHQPGISQAPEAPLAGTGTQAVGCSGFQLQGLAVSGQVSRCQTHLCPRVFLPCPIAHEGSSQLPQHLLQLPAPSKG